MTDVPNLLLFIKIRCVLNMEFLFEILKILVELLAKYLVLDINNACHNVAQWEILTFIGQNSITFDREVRF
jgi:hypothetical protein